MTILNSFFFFSVSLQTGVAESLCEKIHYEYIGHRYYGHFRIVYDDLLISIDLLNLIITYIFYRWEKDEA